MAEETKGTSRRGFLKLAGSAAPAALVAATAAPTQAAANPVDLSSSVMQDTDHTRAYFASARF